MEAAEAQGNPEQLGEHEQVWSELMDLFDQLTDILGQEAVSPADFFQILDSGLEQFDLALTPPTVDQILVGNVDRTRAPNIRAAIVMGLSEGDFPHVPREDSILSDDQRRSLARHGAAIDPDSRRRLFDEHLLGYIALTRAGERLCVTRPGADEAGRSLAPSIFWKRLTAMFPDLKPQVVPRDISDCPEMVGTPRQLLKMLTTWVRQGAELSDPVAPAVYQWLTRHDQSDDQIGTMRRLAWKSLSHRNEAQLSSAIAGRLFPNPLRASVSRIESFAACPFQHFLRYGLKLEEREESDVTPLDLGNVYHAVMEKIVGEVLQGRCDWANHTAKQRQKMVGDFARQVGHSLRDEIFLSSGRSKYLLARIEQTLEKVMAQQSEIAKRGRFRPQGAESEFGRGTKLGAYVLQTPNGKSVELYGKIDRIDVLEDDAAVAVIDYKLTGSRLALDRVYYGISLQLLTYLLVLQANGEKLRGRKVTPAAAFYVKLLKNLESVKHPSDASELWKRPKEKPRGIMSREFISSMDTAFDGRSEFLQVNITKENKTGAYSDAVEHEDFAALLQRVRQKIGELADHILQGHIGIRPYRLNEISPCAYCSYISICRFDSAVDDYNKLISLKRDDVFLKLREEKP